jgi:hypothetical protein
MSTLEIQVYEILKTKLGEEEAAKVIEYFDSKAEEKINQKKDIFLTKDDKVDLIKWMVSLIVGLFIALVTSMAALLKLMVH